MPPLRFGWGGVVLAAAVLGGLGVGFAQARCRAGRPDIVSMVPRQGFRPEVDDSGDEVVRSSDHRTEMTMSCSGLRATVQVEEHASGGGGDDHGGGNSGRGGGDDH